MSNDLQLFLNDYVGKKFNSYEDFETYKQEILYLYNKKLNQEILRFPPNFWAGEDGLLNARIIIDFIITELLQEDVKNIPQLITTRMLREFCLTGLESYHSGYFDLIRTIYPNVFNIGEFKILPRNFWSRPDKYKLAKELIRYNLDLQGLTIDDVCSVNYKDFFYRNNMYTMYIDVFNRKALDAFNCAFEGEHIFMKEDLKCIYKWNDDELCYKVINKTLKELNICIDELMDKTIRKSEYKSIMCRFKNMANLKEFYNSYKSK